MDRTSFETTLRREGFEVVINMMKPNAVNPEHSHTFDARLMIVDGEMTVQRAGGPARTYQTGQIIDIPAGIRHSETAGEIGAAYVAGRRAPQRRSA